MSTTGWLYHLIKNQWTVPVPEQKATFDGQTVIVTGANTGLGLEAAKYMATHGAAKVIMACRSLSKGEAAKTALEKECEKKDVLEVWSLDLASYPSITDFTKRVETELDRLDVLICNAGINYPKFELINDIESTLAVNVVSTFMLAILLLPKLKKTAERNPQATPHLAIVSSDTHYSQSLDKEYQNANEGIFDQLNDQKRASMSSRYMLSKLMDVLLTQQLVAHLPADYPVIINTPNPGLCISELGRELPGAVLTVMNTLFHARTAEVGARNYIYAVSAGRDMHGKFISECREGPLGPAARGDKAESVGAKVWQELTEILEAASPGIMSRLN